jgi:hypothetical protein
MLKLPTVVALVATGLTSLILAGASPAQAEHPTISTRIADADSRTFATASTTTKAVTMQPPTTSRGLQTWWIDDQHVSPGVKVVNQGTGGCLTPEPVSGTVRPAIIQQPCQDTAGEYWRIISSSTTNTVIFRNTGRDGCMAVDPTGTVPARLYLAPCQSDDRNQQFRLVA